MKKYDAYDRSEIPVNVELKTSLEYKEIVKLFKDALDRRVKPLDGHTDNNLVKQATQEFCEVTDLLTKRKEVRLDMLLVELSDKTESENDLVLQVMYEQGLI